MECAESRKKMKLYAAKEIKEPAVIADMEAHIEKCYICKKELMLWQEVLGRQTALKELREKTEFKDRIKAQMKKNDINPQLPPGVRGIDAVSRVWKNKTGKLVIQVSLVLLGVIWVALISKYGINIPALIFALIGFGALIYIMIKNK
ncbi:MAG: hypothetical protein WCJ46_03340 [bacterium]